MEADLFLFAIPSLCTEMCPYLRYYVASFETFSLPNRLPLIILYYDIALPLSIIASNETRLFPIVRANMLHLFSKIIYLLLPLDKKCNDISRETRNINIYIYIYNLQLASDKHDTRLLIVIDKFCRYIYHRIKIIIQVFLAFCTFKKISKRLWASSLKWIDWKDYRRELLWLMLLWLRDIT